MANEFYKEAEIYTRLGTLLKTAWNDEDRLAIDHIMQSSESLKNKLEKIESLAASYTAEGKKTEDAQVIEPLAGTSGEKETLQEKAASPGAPKKDYILLIDDLVYIAKTLSYQLKKENYFVISAHMAFEALQLLQRYSRPSLIISDIKLPDMNGLDLAITIRKMLPDVPFLFITAFIDIDKKKYSQIKGPKMLLHKPINKKDMIDAVNEMTRK